MYGFPILVSMLTYKSWLSGEIFSYSDWPYYQIDALRTNGQLSVWAGWLNFGYFDNVTYWRKPLQILYQFFTFIGLSKEKSDIILAFLPIILLNPIITTYTIFGLTKSKLGAVIGSLFFNFNTYFLAINTQGHLYLTISSGFAFLTLYLFIKNIQQNNNSSILYIAIFSSLVGIIDFRNLYILYGLFLLYLVFNFYVQFREINIKGIKVALKNFFTLTFFVVLLNLFWILIQLSTSTFVSNSITSRGMVFNGFFDVSKSLAVMHPFWSGDEIVWFTDNDIPAYLLIITVITWSSLLAKRSKINVFFGVIALLGVFLTKQSNQPFTQIYEFLFNHLPGFNAFREASKFYLLTVIGYTVLIGTFIAHIESKQNFISKVKPIIRFLIVIILFFLISWNTKPFVLNSVKSLMHPIDNQLEYSKFNDKIIKNNEFSRILWIPGDLRWSTYNNKHPKINYIDVIFNNWKLFRNEMDDSKFNPTKSILILINDSTFNQLLDNSSISYIAIPSKFQQNNLDSFIDKNLLKRQLDSQNFLHFRKELSKEGLLVYENKDYKPHIYFTNEIESIEKLVQYTHLLFKSNNPSSYKLEFKIGSKPTFLNFSEAYYPNWKLRSGQFNWLASIIQKDYYYPEKYHFESDIGLNYWKIDPQWFKDQGYEEGDNVPITLYFAPQAWMKLGIIISSSTFIFLIASLSYLSFKEYVKNKK